MSGFLTCSHIAGGGFTKAIDATNYGRERKNHVVGKGGVNCVKVEIGIEILENIEIWKSFPGGGMDVRRIGATAVLNLVQVW